MSKKLKVFLTLVLLIFFSIQWYLTLFGGFLWPFSGHRLFSQLASKKKTIVQAVLIDSNGDRYCVHPGQVIPIEYSRCSGLIRRLYAKGSREKQQSFCRYLLYRLNEEPWLGFDEMFTPIRPSSQAKFVDLHFEHQTIEFRQESPQQPVHLLEKTHLFP